MLRLILLLAVVGCVWWWLFDWRRTPVELRKQKAIQIGLYALALCVIVMVVTGRAHILYAPLALALPYLRRIMGNRYVLGWLFSQWQARKTGGAQSGRNHQGVNAGSKMDDAQAREILGFEVNEPLDVAMIKTRHRRLIQKIHPDKSEGSAFLSAQVNEAREVLLASIDDNSEGVS